MFGWKNGIMGDAYLARTRAGKEAVVFKGRPGLRARLPGTRYLREHPIVREAGFVIGYKEMLEEAGKATKIAVVCFVAWDIVHELLQNKPDMTRLGVTIVSDIFQAVAATYIGVGVGLLAAFFGGTIIISFCCMAAASFLVGYGFLWLDSHFGLTNKAVALAKKIEASHPMHCFIKYAEDIEKSYVNSYAMPYIAY